MSDRLLDPRAQQVQLAQRDRQGPPDQQGFKVPLVHKAFKVSKATLGLQEQLAQQVTPVQQVLLVLLPDLLDLQVKLAPQDRLAQQVPQDQLDLLDLLAEQHLITPSLLLLMIQIPAAELLSSTKLILHQLLTCLLMTKPMAQSTSKFSFELLTTALPQSRVIFE